MPREDGDRLLPVELEISVEERPGETRSARLECRGERALASGFLAGDPASACRAARRLAPLLADEPDPDRICTQVYGGPQTARLTGRVGGRQVDRRLARTDGCEIAEWDRAAALLGGPPAGDQARPRP